jgi:hypothetical protein
MSVSIDSGHGGGYMAAPPMLLLLKAKAGGLEPVMKSRAEVKLRSVWFVRWAAMLVLAAGIVVAVLLPVQMIRHPCGVVPEVCRFTVNLRLPQRFAIGLASALPLAIILSGRSIRRWMVAVGVVEVSSGIALAAVLPSHSCLGLGGVFCPIVDHPWERFAIVVAALGVGVLLVATSRVPGSRLAVGTMLLIAGITTALFLPSTEGSPLFVPSGYRGDYLDADHRVTWRIVMALTGAILFAVVLASRRRASQAGPQIVGPD